MKPVDSPRGEALAPLVLLAVIRFVAKSIILESKHVSWEDVLSIKKDYDIDKLSKVL